MAMKDCVFCKIIAGEIPSHIIWEDKKHIAFLSIFPNTPGFSVVAAKKHMDSYVFNNADKVISDLLLATKKVAKILDATFDDVARCGMFFEGYGVDHLHSRLFPMHGTSKLDSWEEVIDEDMRKVFFDKYMGYLSSHDGEKADEKELEEIAKKARKAAKSLKI